MAENEFVVDQQSVVDQLRQSTARKLRSGKIGIVDLCEAAETVRLSLGLDMVFAVSNAEYRYQLDHIVTCTASGSIINAPSHSEITEARYVSLSQEYARSQFSTDAIPELSSFSMASQLYTAVMHDGEFYGIVGFGCSQNREWSQSDRDALEYLSFAVLFYLGLSRLATGSARDYRVKQKAESENIISCYHIDLQTGRCHIAKLAPFLKGFVDEWMPYDRMIGMYAAKFVDPAYSNRMLDTFNIGSLMRALCVDAPIVSMDLPRILNGQAHWICCSVEALSYGEDGCCSRAVATVRDVTEAKLSEAITTHDLNMGGRDYSTIIGVNLETGRYVIYLDNRTGNAPANDDLGPAGDYESVVSFIAGSCVDPDLAHDYQERFSVESMTELFDAGVLEISLDFPCMFSDAETWLRLEALPSAEYAQGKRVILLYCTDITTKKNRELQFEEIKQSLEIERARSEEKDLMLTLDPLTGAYNRVGYDKYIESLAGGSDSIGYLMIDVDHFKELNDNFGHDAGDEALVNVVKLLKKTFRTEDMIFRMGGDEFIMILDGCKAGAWESVRGKIAAIHDRLKGTIATEDGITLSAGFVISETGFESSLPGLADEALYVTKRNGRAGLTLVDKHGDVINSWNEDASSASKRDIRMEVGKWRYVCPRDGFSAPRLFFDETARLIMGIPDSLTPEQCYELWVASLPDELQGTLRDMKGKTTEAEQAEVTHALEHPKQGTLRLRTRVKYIGDDDAEEYIGHFVVLKDEEMILTPDNRQFVIQAMSNVFISSYFIDLRDGTYSVMKGFDDQPGSLRTGIASVLERFVAESVHPDQRSRVAEFFDLQTLQARLEGKGFVDCEYLALDENGWRRSRFLPVKRDESGAITHVVLASVSVDSEKREELEQVKRVEDSMKLQLRVGEMVSKGNVLQICIISKDTGDAIAWKEGPFQGKGELMSFEATKEACQGMIHPEDRLLFERDYQLANIVKSVEENGECTLAFRILGEDGQSRVIMHHFETLASDPSKILAAIEEVTSLVPQGIGWMTEFDMLESINTAITVIDYDSFEIVYMNKSARDCVDKGPDELAGMKCYELYNRTDHPCSFCKDLIREDGENCFVVRDELSTGRSIIINGSVMELNGRRYRLEEVVPNSQFNESKVCFVKTGEA